LLDRIAGELRGEAGAEVLIASANGTFIDAGERAVAANYFPDSDVYTAKPALGESVAAGALWQVICATQALRRQELPPVLHAPKNCSLTSAREAGEKAWQRAVVTTCGLNQQVAGLALGDAALCETRR
jgi:3-oxoacyl-(acyl-carrier-protein) synthase